MKRREEWLEEIIAENKQDTVTSIDDVFGEQVQSAVDSGANRWDVQVDLHRLNQLIIENTNYASDYMTHLENPDKSMVPVSKAEPGGLDAMDPELRDDNLAELRELTGKYPGVARQMIDFEEYSLDETARANDAAFFENLAENGWLDKANVPPISVLQDDLEDMIPKMADSYGPDAAQARSDLYQLYDLAEQYPDYAVGLVSHIREDDQGLSHGYGPFPESEIESDTSGITRNLSELRDLSLKYPDFAEKVAAYERVVIQVVSEPSMDEPLFDGRANAEPAFDAGMNFDDMFDDFVDEATGEADMRRVAEDERQAASMALREQEMAYERESGVAPVYFDPDELDLASLQRDMAQVAEEERQAAAMDLYEDTMAYERESGEMAGPVPDEPDLADIRLEMAQVAEEERQAAVMDLSQETAAYEHESKPAPVRHSFDGPKVGCDKSLAGLDLQSDGESNEKSYGQHNF